MKKTVLSTFLAIILSVSAISTSAAFTQWTSPRYIPEDEYKTPWTEAKEGNPYVTYYAPWLRQLHIMTAAEAENNKEAGIVGGEACQQIRQIAISPVDSKIMYLCSDTSGVYKTTNGGEHWYSTTNNAAGHDAKGLLCDNKDKEIVYVNMRKVGVHRSKNGGKTWEQLIADTDSTQNVDRRSNTIAQDSSGNTYFAVGSGVYKLDRATDTVTNLTAGDFPALAALKGSNGAEFVDIDVSPDGKYIYACCALTISGTGVDAGLYVSENGGESWEVRSANPNGSQTYSHIRTLAIDPADTTYKTIYAGLRIIDTATAATGEYNLYVSKDGGNTYNKVYRPQNLSGDNLYFYGLKFGPANSSGIYPLYFHLEKTVYPLRVSYNYTDSNPDFLEVYKAKHKMDADTLRSGYTGYLYQAFQPDMSVPGRVIFAASGIYEYILGQDGTSTINRISSGYSGASLRDIAFDSKNRIFAPATDIDTIVCDGGAYTETTYPTFKIGDGTAYGVRAVFDPNEDNHVIMFVGYSNGNGTYAGIKQSSDGGKTFGEKDAEGKLINHGFADGAKLYYSKPEDDTQEDTGGETEEDTEGETEEDLGNTGGESTESDTDTSATLGWATYGNARVLCYDKDDTNIIYSSYHNSTDNGKTWKKNEYFILDVHPTNTKLQVGIKGTGTSTVLYKTTDGGATWSEIGPLGYSDLKDVDFDLKNDNYVWFTREEKLGRIDLSNGAVTDYTYKFNADSNCNYKAFRQIEINPKNPDHMLVTSFPGHLAGSMHNDFKLAESYDNGESWHTVPGLWGGAFNNIVFSPTTNEAFILGHAGTFIYDYEKFNYYQAVGLCYNDSIVMQTLPRVNAEGKNVNNGGYIVAPEDLFTPKYKRFTGWQYGNKTYMPGEKIPIGSAD